MLSDSAELYCATVSLLVIADILPSCTNYYIITFIHRSIHLDVFHFLDGLVKKLEELEKTAELYKGKCVLYICRVELYENFRFTNIHSTQLHPQTVYLVGLMEHTKRLLRAFFELSQSHRGE